MRRLSAIVLVMALMTLAGKAWAAINFVASYGASGTGTSAKVKPTTSAGVAAGNLYVAQIAVVNGSCASLGTPSGWTKLVCTAYSNHIQAVFTRPAQPSDLNQTFNFPLGATRSWASILLSYSGVDLANPIDAGPSTATYSNSKNATAASITTVTPGAWAVLLTSANYRGRNIFTPPSGYTERRERRCPTGVACTITASDRNYPTPGATGSVTTTVANNASGIVHLFALRPYSLVSWWPLDGTPWTQDVAGSNPLTAQGDAAPAAAKVCTGFNGTGAGWLTAADSASLDLPDRYTLSAWVYPVAYPVSGSLKTILSKGGNYAIHLNAAGKLEWRWTDSGGTAQSLTSTATIPLNQWTHVAVVFDRMAATNRQRIYINGVADATVGNIGTAAQTNNAALYIGSDAGYTSGANNRNFIGLIDEVRLYNGAIGASQISADMGASHDCGVDHYRLTLADGQGLTCTPEPVTVTACANATCSALYVGLATVTLTASGGASVSPNPVNLVGGNASVDVSKSSAGVVTLGVSAATPSPSGVPGYRCFIGNTEVPWTSCQINFQQARLTIDVPDFIACTGTREATITAEGCGSTLSGSQNLKVWMSYDDPNTANGEALRIGALTVPTSKPATTNLTLTFDTEGVATLPVVNYDDAGDLTLSAELVSGGTTLSGQGSFGVAPDRLEVMPQDTTAVCANTAQPETCNAYRKAGEPFNLVVKALCSSGKVTKNFRADVPLSATLKAPAAGVNGAFAPTVVTLSAADNGQKTFPASYSEVGVITVTPGPVNYKGQTVNGLESAWLGRFFPDHFDTATSNACGAFTYSGQRFPLTVTARAAGGTTTQNYAGAFARTVSFIDANGTPGSFDSLAPGAFVSGVADTSASPLIAFTFSNKLSAPATVKVRANDTDTVNAVGLSEGEIHVRSGRLVLSNAHGSDLLDLVLPFQTQYWTGSAWATNTLDSCTDLTGQFVFVKNPAGMPTPTGGTVTSGKGSLTFSAPGMQGSVLVCANIGNDGDNPITTCRTGSSYPWLQGSWDADGQFNDNPSARASFGIFEQKSPIIYRRERY